MENEILVRYIYNSLILTDAFKKELKQYYSVQTKPIYISSAKDGGEMWFQIFLNVDFGEFIKGAIAGGLVWDIIEVGTKKYFLNPLITVQVMMSENITYLMNLKNYLLHKIM